MVETYSMETLGGVATSVLIALVCWKFDVVSEVFSRIGLKLNEVPDGIPGALWNAISLPSKKKGPLNPGPTIGFLEIIIGIGVVWCSSFQIAGGWLVFKVAAKWQSWGQIVRIPEKFGDQDPIESFRLRRALGEKIMARFLIGTALSLLLGIIAGHVGKLIAPQLIHLIPS